MKPHPSVSVIVICHNAARSLPEAVEIVLARTNSDARLPHETEV